MSVLEDVKHAPSSSRTSTQSYPSAKSLRGSSFPPSDGGFWSSAAASVDLPLAGWPRMSTCLEGMEREEETESRMLDQRSCGGASGDEGRELSSIVRVWRRQKSKFSSAGNSKGGFKIA